MPDRNDVPGPGSGAPLRITDLLPFAMLEDEALRLDLALAQTAIRDGEDPNLVASPDNCMLLRRHAALTVVRYALLGDVLHMGEGIRLHEKGVDYSPEALKRAMQYGQFGVPLSRQSWPIPGADWDRRIGIPKPDRNPTKN